MSGYRKGKGVFERLPQEIVGAVGAVGGMVTAKAMAKVGECFPNTKVSGPSTCEQLFLIVTGVYLIVTGVVNYCISAGVVYDVYTVYSKVTVYEP